MSGDAGARMRTADLDAIGEVGDQRHAEADAGTVRPWAQPDAVVGDGDLDAVVVQTRGHMDRTGAFPVTVRMHDGIRHGL
jgi:hypothetical protein